MMLVCYYSMTFCFNSRTPGGVRLLSNEIPAYEKEFQFTHPGRGATRAIAWLVHCTDVSIHAPREGCDYQ